VNGSDVGIFIGMRQKVSECSKIESLKQASGKKKEEKKRSTPPL